jgi:hypothetical protein
MRCIGPTTRQGGKPSHRHSDAVRISSLQFDVYRLLSARIPSRCGKLLLQFILAGLDRVSNLVAGTDWRPTPENSGEFEHPGIVRPGEFEQR